MKLFHRFIPNRRKAVNDKKVQATRTSSATDDPSETSQKASEVTSRNDKQPSTKKKSAPPTKPVDTDEHGHGEKKKLPPKEMHLGCASSIFACAWMVFKILEFILTLGPPWKMQTVPWLCVKFQLLLGLACLVGCATQTSLVKNIIKQLRDDCLAKRISMTALDVLSLVLTFNGSWVFFEFLGFVVKLAPMVFAEDSKLCLFLTLSLLGLVCIVLHRIFQTKLVESTVTRAWDFVLKHDSETPENTDE